MTGHGIAVVDMALFEIPARQLPGFRVTIETNRQASVVVVDAGDGGEVAVEYPEPTLVLAAQDPVPDLEDPVACVERQVR